MSTEGNGGYDEAQRVWRQKGVTTGVFPLVLCCSVPNALLLSSFILTRVIIDTSNSFSGTIHRENDYGFCVPKSRLPPQKKKITINTARRSTVFAMDVVYGLKRQGRVLYGFGG